MTSGPSVISAADAVEILRLHAAELRALGIEHAAVFGSVARGEARLGSDLDILVKLDSSLRLDAFGYAGLKRHVSELFSVEVDVVNAAALKEPVARTALQDAIYAF